MGLVRCIWARHLHAGWLEIDVPAFVNSWGDPGSVSEVDYLLYVPLLLLLLSLLFLLLHRSLFFDLNLLCFCICINLEFLYGSVVCLMVTELVRLFLK